MKPDKKLREYQQLIIEKALIENNVVIVLPQGTGKTVIGLNIMKLGTFKKVIILVNRKNLINSWLERSDEWLSEELIPLDSNMKPEERTRAYAKNFIISTVHLFKSELRKCKTFLSDYDLIIIDESAEGVAKFSGGYRKSTFYNFLKDVSHIKIVGLMPPYMNKNRIKSVSKSFNAKIISIPYTEVKQFLPRYKTIIEKVEDPFITRVDKIISKKIKKIHTLIYKRCREYGLNVIKEGVFSLTKKELLMLDENTQRLFWRMRSLLDFKQKLFYGNRVKLKDHRLYKHPDGKNWVDKPDQKIKRIVQLIKERQGQKILLFCDYKEILKYIHNIFLDEGIKSEILTGDTVDRLERKKIVNRFRFGDKDILLSTAVLDAGVDLPQGDCVIHYTFSWDSYRHRQKSGRIRGGEEIFIVYEDSSEIEKLKSLTNELKKEENQFIRGEILLE